MSLYIYDINYGSYVNGPGRRTMLHLAGCNIRCPGCFSKHTWKRDVFRHMYSVPSAALELMKEPADGLTISGGEPSEQLPELIKLLERPGLLEHFGKGGVIVYSGLGHRELFQNEHWQYMCKNDLVDAVVVGPYREDMRLLRPSRLCSSSNQSLILTSDLFSEEDFDKKLSVEVRVAPSTVTIQGFPRSEDVASVKAVCS